MTHKAQEAMKHGAARFRRTCKEAFERGFERGYNTASWVDMPEIGSTLRTESDGKVEVTEENIWDVMRSLAFDAESNDRSFSPFEHTASEFNKAQNSEARWEAFDEGISDGIFANLEERKEFNSNRP